MVYLFIFPPIKKKLRFFNQMEKEKKESPKRFYSMMDFVEKNEFHSKDIIKDLEENNKPRKNVGLKLKNISFLKRKSSRKRQEPLDVYNEIKTKITEKGLKSIKELIKENDWGKNFLNLNPISIFSEFINDFYFTYSKYIPN
jgi:hypothetical protein